MELVFLLILVIAYVLIIISGIRKHSLSTPYFLFSCIWLVILVVYFLHSNKWYDISLEASICIFAGSVSFLVSAIVAKQRTKERRVAVSSDNSINLILFIVCSVITVYCLLDQAVENMKYMALGMNYSDIKAYTANNNIEASGGPIKTIATMLIARPFSFAVIPIIGLELSASKKRWWMILVCIGILVLNVLQSGQRSFLLFTIPAILLVIMTKENVKKRTLTFKQIVGAVVLTIVVFVGISWLSMMRDTSISETYASYISGCIPSFSERIKVVPTYYYGAGFFHGILVVIFIGLKFLGNPYPAWWVRFDELIESFEAVKTGPNSYINAFNTMFYIPYLDFGFIGVVIESLIVGIIIGKAYAKMKARPTAMRRCVYSVMTIGLFGSMYTLYFTQYPFLFSFFYLYILFKQKTK